MFGDDLLLEPIAVQVYGNEYSANFQKSEWICVTCGQTFHREGMLNRHLETHAHRRTIQNRRRSGLYLTFDEDLYSDLRFSGFETSAVLAEQTKRHKHISCLDSHINRLRRRRRQSPLLYGFGSSIDQNKFDFFRLTIGLQFVKCMQLRQRVQSLRKVIEQRHQRRETTFSAPEMTRSFECYLCRETFDCLEDNSIHMRTHTGYMPFECRCHRRFMFLDPFLAHLRSH